MPGVSKQQFGARLQELRLARGWSQADLAQNAGVNVWAVRQWEGGRSDPGWTSVVALADALGVSTEAFREAPQAPRRKWARGRPKKQPPPGPREVRCPGCGAAFVTDDKAKRYHGSTCRSRACRRRKKAGMTEEPPCDT
jgi:transcriptional regulator with XRE-family HTH domain